MKAIQSEALFGYGIPMPQSLSKVIIHLIFSTKERYPWLNATVRRLSCNHLPRRGRGSVPCWRCADHIHLVTTLPRALSQADLVEGLKKKSSKWIKGLASEYRHFLAARPRRVSVSPSQLDALLAYVESQDEHHRSRTFQEEYREFLRKYGIEYDERYVWD
jgi:putative transposase